MSSDIALRDDDGNLWSFDNLCTQKWLNGKVSGAEQCIGVLCEQAVELFRAGKTTEAVNLRGLAHSLRDSLLPQLRSEAERHKAEFPELLEEKR